MTSTTTPSPDLRVITVALTDHAPDIAFLPLNHPDRLRHVWNKSLGAVVRASLRRIGRAPADMTAAHWGDDPALFGNVAGEPAPRPLAVFWAGATVDQLAACLADLVAAGWTPPPPTPTPGAANPFDVPFTTGARP